MGYIYNFLACRGSRLPLAKRLFYFSLFTLSFFTSPALAQIEDGKAFYAPTYPVRVVDTTGAGDSFFAGVAIGLTYGRTLPESCVIGSRLAASVIGQTIRL